MKRLISILFLTAVAAVTSSGHAQDRPPALVVVDSVTSRSVAMTSPFVGTMDFEKFSDIAPEVAGKVVTLNVREGSYVRKGDVLLTVDTRLLESDIDILKSQISEKMVKLEDSGSRLKRAEELFNRGIISKQEYETELYADKSLETEAETLVGRLDRLETELEKSTLRAPFDGLIMEKKTDVGQWVKPDAPVCSIASTSDVFVRVAVPEDIVRYVSLGAKLDVRIEALGRELNGTVSGIVPVADVRSRNFNIKVRVPFFKGAVKNMSATVQVPVSPESKLSIIKRDALIRNQGKDFVYTVKDGKAAILPVHVVAYLGSEVGVDDPYIVPGMPVVVEGNERLMPDQPVTVSGGM